MNRNTPVYLLTAGAGGYLLIRRLGLRRGATNDEVTASLPGDEVIPDPMLQTTHAITIHVSPSVVWKWLIQAGHRGSRRAGWYSDSWIDPLLDRYVWPLIVPDYLVNTNPGMRSSNEIIPELQHTSVGDIVPDSPPGPGAAYFVVEEVEPERAWVLYSDTHARYLSPKAVRGTRFESYGDFTWSFVLRPLDTFKTRLILRTRIRYGPRMLGTMALPVIYLSEAIFPMAILRGIKRRAERERAQCGAKDDIAT